MKFGLFWAFWRFFGMTSLWRRFVPQQGMKGDVTDYVAGWDGRYDRGNSKEGIDVGGWHGQWEAGAVCGFYRTALCTRVVFGRTGPMQWANDTRPGVRRENRFLSGTNLRTSERLRYWQEPLDGEGPIRWLTEGGGSGQLWRGDPPNINVLYVLWGYKTLVIRVGGYGYLINRKLIKSQFLNAQRVIMWFMRAS